MGIDNKNPSIKKNRNKNKKIVFDDEIITKDSAIERVKYNEKTEIPRTKSTDEVKDSSHPGKSSIQKKSPRNKKKKRSNHNPNEETITNNKLDSPNDEKDDKSESQLDESDIPNTTDNLNEKKEESIRAKKRKRHMELLQAKKLRSEINLQEKCLNYLSMWKHSKLQWKFEKLKQIWLQQNMFDDAKVPEEFWDTLVEYFNSAKGQAKAKILTDAVKIVDSLQEMDDENPEKSNAKYVRARNIVQNLQE